MFSSVEEESIKNASDTGTCIEWPTKVSRDSVWCFGTIQRIGRIRHYLRIIKTPQFSRPVFKGGRWDGAGEAGQGEGGRFYWYDCFPGQQNSYLHKNGMLSLRKGFAP